MTVNRLNFLDWGSITYVGNGYPCMRVPIYFSLCINAITIELLTVLLVVNLIFRTPGGVPAIWKGHRSYMNQTKYEFVKVVVMEDPTCENTFRFILNITGSGSFSEYYKPGSRKKSSIRPDADPLLCILEWHQISM